MDVRFPGGLRVEALHDGYRILTDQPAAMGGGGTAPSPFDLFLASIGTCAGFYALRFCQQRHLETEGLALTLTAGRDPAHHRVATVRLDIALPRGFPEKYRGAIVNAVDQCSVKKHLAHPPGFEVVVAGESVRNAAEELAPAG